MVALVALGVIAYGRLAPRRVPSPTSAPGAGPAPGESGEAIAARMRELNAAGRYVQAVPDARWLIAEHRRRGSLTGPMLTDLARILNNAAFQDDVHGPRSSVERVALEREALAAAHEGLRMATTPRERADGLDAVAFIHSIWGFPYDAYVTYRSALDADPTAPEARMHYQQFIQRFRPSDAHANAR